jgi:guanylate kinase
LREPVIANLKQGLDVLIDIDTQGAAAIRRFDDPFIQVTDVLLCRRSRRIAPASDEPWNGNSATNRLASRLRGAKWNMARLSLHYYQSIGGRRFAEFRNIVSAESYLSRRLIRNNSEMIRE